MKQSAGFRAWLSTTDDRLPLSEYMTVLEGTAMQMEQLEERLDALKERAERVQEGEDWDLAEYILRVVGVEWPGLGEVKTVLVFEGEEHELK